MSNPAKSAIGFPTYVPQSAFGANDRIVYGHIGVGGMGSSHIVGDSCAALCDVDANHLASAAKRVQGKPMLTDDYRRVLDRKDIDAVTIGTPDHWHAIMAVHACMAGKDVYSEKPVCKTIEEGLAMVNAARRYKRIMQIGAQGRSNPKVAAAANYLRNGKAGDIKKVVIWHPENLSSGSGFETPSNPPSHMNWDMWLGPTPDRPYSSVLSPRGNHNHFPAWRNYREFSGGGHADIGAHMYDIMQWGLGTDASGPVEVLPPDDPSEGQGARFIMPNGVEITHGGASGVVFTGTRGMLRVDRGVLFSNPKELIQDPLADSEVHLLKSPGHHRNWLDCIKSRERCLCDVEIGARSNQYTQLGNLAYWHGRKLKWDPVKWKFPGDKEANTWLDYERRPQWKLPKA